MEVREDDLLGCLEEKILDGKNLVDRLKTIEATVEGVDKLVRKINQEIRFLVKVRSTGIAKKEHLQSTNLIHLTALVERLFASKDPVCVMRPFKHEDGTRLEVDIVCDSGASWVKVVARNARALTLVSLGNGEYGQKSVVDQAETYLRCASLHPHRYKPPEVVFHFACGVEAPLANRLERLGLVVSTEEPLRTTPKDCDTIAFPHVDELVFSIVDDLFRNNSVSLFVEAGTLTENAIDERKMSSEFDRDSSSDDCQEENSRLRIENLSSNVDSTSDIRILNLDVSTLLAYVSNMTNGHANYIYREPLLTKQAEWERARPIKPILDKLFEAKELIVCETAYKNFMDIIGLIGGPSETTRAKALDERIKVVDDAREGRIIERLRLGGKIKNRSRLVFATGETTRSITVSANEGFVRAARMQGIECTVVLHEPRSLSELKEKHATPIEIS